MKSTVFERHISKIKKEVVIPKNKIGKSDFLPRYLSNGMKEFLSPDSYDYRSTLNPVFSFDLELLDDNYFEDVNVFSLRDGVLPLLRFFTLNPQPSSRFPLLIIDHALSSLIPPGWRDVVLLRSPFTECKQIEKTREKIIIFISPNIYSLPLDLLQTELLLISAKLKPTDEVYLFFSSVRSRGEGDASYDTAWGYKIIQKIFQVFGNDRVKVLNWLEYLKVDLSESYYCFINPLNLFFTDSFLLHDASQRGAIPFLEKKIEMSESYAFGVSHAHGFLLHNSFHPFKDKVKNISDQFFSSLETYKMRKKDPHHIFKMTTDEFRNWAIDVSLELYNEKT